MNEARIPFTQLLDRLPPEWPDDLLATIQQRIAHSKCKVVVLDDDPTGTQTVNNVPVLTGWPVKRLVEALTDGTTASASRTFYLLTNSRALPLEAARALNQEIGANLRAASSQAGRDFAVISRSDSTLRGHFPGEVAALASALEGEPGVQGHVPFNAWLVAPFFPEGGRYTIDDVHWVLEGEWLVPAGQTEFARDASFGYRSSNLREWVAEKTGGSVPAEKVASISLTDLRQGGPGRITNMLLDLPHGSVCVANAASYRDLEVLVLGLLDAEATGWRCLYRTAASFVRVRAGIAPRPLLTPDELHLPDTGGGLVIAGSYVPKTTAQLEALISETSITPIEVPVEQLLDETTRQKTIETVRDQADALLSGGRDTVIFTSRRLVHGENAENNLAIGQTVSNGLVAILQQLRARPRYLLAKGGITSSDLATRGLGVEQALVLGQILPGVPVWATGPESRFPGLTYIVFPGNVGAPDALAKVVKALQRADD